MWLPHIYYSIIYYKNIQISIILYYIYKIYNHIILYTSYSIIYELCIGYRIKMYYFIHIYIIYRFRGAGQTEAPTS